MTHKNHHQPDLPALMQKSLVKIPFSDFEETVMHQIRIEVKKQASLLRDRKRSFFFFIAGSTIGIGISFILQKSEYFFLGISPQTLLLSFQTIFVLFFLIQLEKFIHQFRRSKQYR